MIEKIIDFVKENSGKWLESPRKSFFKGKSLKAKRFRVSLKPSGDKIIFEFEKGTKYLAIELWRFEESIEFLNTKNNPTEIGARISEDYSKDSLEGHIKDIAKEKFGRKTDTKTAPHVVDLLVLANTADLDYAIASSGRKVQGVKLKDKSHTQHENLRKIIIS
jgi:hypothetical protein